jgi:hypothetical protein
MREKTLQLSIYLATALMIACVNHRIHPGMTAPSTIVSPSPTPTPLEALKNEADSNSPIRRIDFENFSFPELPSKKCLKQVVRLINGRYDAPAYLKKLPSVDCWSVVLTGVSYGDITGDGNDEAIVTLYAELGGNSSYSDVYLYSLTKNQPTLLWKFMTGDRADGGLKKIYPESGDLVIELFGVGTKIGSLESREDVADCCPKHFTRTRYKWDGKYFRQDGEEIFPIPPQ